MIETVTVTAAKRAENIQNVPLSILAVTGQSLANANVNNLQQLVKIVPNLQITRVAQSAGVIIRIRGFGSGSNAAIDPDVTPYVDGVYIPRPGALISSFLDVSTVEVLRGPQGTLQGRNAVMGAILINTVAPSVDRRSLDLSAQRGSFGLASGEFIANLPLSDTLAVRMALAGSHLDGFWQNSADGKTYGGSDIYTGRLSAKWEATPDLSWIVRLDGTLMDGDGLNPSAIYTKSASPAQLAQLTNVLALFDTTPPTMSYPPSFRLNQRFQNPNLHDSQYGIASDANWTLSETFAVRLVNSYRNWSESQNDGDVGFTNLDLLNRRQTFSSKSSSHELQLITPKNAFLDGKLGFTAGLYYFEESYALNEILDLGSQFCSLVYATNPGLIAPCQAAPHMAATHAPFSQRVESVAVYAQANYWILPDLGLNIGARQTWDKKSGLFQQMSLNPFAAAGVLRAPEGPQALSLSDSEPSWLASLSWHLDDDVMLFVTYATGYKSGGFNSAPGSVALTPAFRSFDSETSDDIELGLKSQWWDNRIQLNATLFSTRLYNFQDRSFNGVSFVIRNSGTVRSRGLEVESQMRPLNYLSVNFSFAYLDSIYSKNLAAPQYSGCSAVVINAACPGVQNLSGRLLPFAPKWQGNVGFEVNSDPFLGGFTASFQLNETFTSSYQTENTSSPQTTVAGYGLTDARLSFYSPDSAWQLDIKATNLFDKHYFTGLFPQTLAGAFGLNNSTTGATLFRGFVGDPRSVSMRLAFKY